MSLDVYLTIEGEKQEPQPERIFIREDGSIREISREEWNQRFPDREPAVVPADPGGEDDAEVFHANITHNLTKMAREAGIYEQLWRPDEIGITRAEQLITPLVIGLAELNTFPGKFIPLNPSNGWGSYEGLVKFVSDYLNACMKFPKANVRVGR